MLYLGERLSAIQIAGGTVIFACMVAVQILPLFERGGARHHEANVQICNDGLGRNRRLERKSPKPPLAGIEFVVPMPALDCQRPADIVMAYVGSSHRAI